MRKGLYLKLAVTNIRKNKSTYIPYIITCVVCIAMMYMMMFINRNEGMDYVYGSGQVKMLMLLGIWVIIIFSFIFLLYSNSFLMKRRQKEIGLYNILGMEKGHISKMMFLETIMTSIVSMALGILVGILGSKLALLFLLRLIHIPAQFGFYVSVPSVVFCMETYGVIFFLTLINNLRRVHVSRPIELLQGSSVGEREPKAKWILAILGFICLGAGYYIAIHTESPLDALLLFFVAVLLVMAGTYLLFTTGSIAILKMLRWKKSFYYKTKNFTTVSGMIYRMKQNAVGLASICILSTGVLLMLSTTVCLYSGMKDITRIRFPRDVNCTVKGITLEKGKLAVDTMRKAVEEEQVPWETVEEQVSLDMICNYDETGVTFEDVTDDSDLKVDYISVIPADVYENMAGEETELEDGHVLAYFTDGNEKDVLNIMGTKYQIDDRISKWPGIEDPNPYNILEEGVALIVTDHDFTQIDNLQKEALGSNASLTQALFRVDIKGSEEELYYGHRLDERFTEMLTSSVLGEDGVWGSCDIRAEEYNTFYSLYGGLFFLGIFLGGLFLVGTAIIIYYKQMSEGYEDKDRFEIMQKVGMSRQEVKSSIRRQILMVFFAPLLVAILHITIAFFIVKRLLLLLGMANTGLFIACIAGTILVYAVVYGIIYSMTARSYYKIVERAQ